MEDETIIYYRGRAVDRGDDTVDTFRSWARESTQHVIGYIRTVQEQPWCYSECILDIRKYAKKAANCYHRAVEEGYRG